MSNTAVKVVLSDTEVALHEGMANIVLVTLGENLRPKIVCESEGLKNDHEDIWRVTATVTPPSTGRLVTFTSNMPISRPDAEYTVTRIANRFFNVTINDYFENFSFEAWCECNPSNGAMAVVRMIRPNSPDRWLVGGGMDEEVHYRGEFARLPQWVKDIAYLNYGGWIDTDGANLGSLLVD